MTAVELRPAAAVARGVVPWFDGGRNLGGVMTWLGRAGVAEGMRSLLDGAPAWPLAVDIETEGKKLPKCDRIHVVGVGTAEQVVLFDPRDPRQADALRMVLGVWPQLIFHNSPYDVPILHRNGLFERDWCAKVIDTLIYARMAWPAQTTSKALGDLAIKLLGRPRDQDWMKQAAKAEKLSTDRMYETYDVDRPIYVMGNAADVSSTAALLPKVRAAAWAQLTEGHPFVEYGATGAEAERMLEREQVINRGRLRRACLGFRVDFEFADNFADRFDGELEQASKILAAHDVKAGDSASLVRWADAQGLIPDAKRHPRLKSGAPTGEKKYLERLASPLVKLFLAHKTQHKIQHDYLTKMRDLSVNGRIHPVINIFGASTTGRNSAGSPPVQQFPPGARGMILFEDDDPATSFDWRQIEPVTAANLAGDRAVLDAYERGTGDPYQSIGDIAGITRKAGKIVILADMYGQGLALLAANLGCSIDEARAIKTAARSGYQVTTEHFARIKAVAEQYQCVPTVSGRILPVQRQLDEESGRWRVATHMAVNYHVQGSAYDMLAEAEYAMELEGLGDRLHLPMHDELVVSTSAAAEVERIMRTPPPALVRLAKRVPVLHIDRADLGERWAYV